MRVLRAQRLFPASQVNFKENWKENILWARSWLEASVETQKSITVGKDVEYIWWWIKIQVLQRRGIRASWNPFESKL